MQVSSRKRTRKPTRKRLNPWAGAEDCAVFDGKSAISFATVDISLRKARCVTVVRVTPNLIPNFGPPQTSTSLGLYCLLTQILTSRTQGVPVDLTDCKLRAHPVAGA